MSNWNLVRERKAKAMRHRTAGASKRSLRYAEMADKVYAATDLKNNPKFEFKSLFDPVSAEAPTSAK